MSRRRAATSTEIASTEMLSQGRSSTSRLRKDVVIAAQVEVDLEVALAGDLEVRIVRGEQHALLPRRAQIDERLLERRERDHRREVDAVQIERERDRVVVAVQPLLRAVREDGHVSARNLVLLAGDEGAVLHLRLRRGAATAATTTTALAAAAVTATTTAGVAATAAPKKRAAQ